MSNEINKIGIAYDPSFLVHETGPGHPESPERISFMGDFLEKSPHLGRVEIKTAGREDLLLIHDTDYIDKIMSMTVTDIEMLDPDTAVSPGSRGAALKAVGAVIAGVDNVIDKIYVKVFCAVRPPGHHAEKDKAMGFCLFNNVAVGAKHALVRKGLNRIAIIDWDVHHGNGSQNAFYNSDQVLYISLHQFPFYPGTGSTLETGEGAGRGFTINIPMSPGAGDDDYSQAFESTIIPAVDSFKPELILISAGFDAHQADHLAHINLTTGFFGKMTSMAVDMANRYCQGRIVSVLEGGYNIPVLRECIEEHLKELE